MLDRDELAARFAVAAYGDGREWSGTREDLAEYAVKQADALLAALASKPVATAAPVEAAPGKYVPKVGDVVTHVEYPGEEFTIQSVDEWGVTTQRTDAGVRYDTEGTCGSADNLRYLRDSTDAEKRAAGLAVPPPAPTPAPEAKRPTHVRVTRLGKVNAGVTVGKVYRVESWWKKDGSPFILNDDDVEVSLSAPDGYDGEDFPTWEPSPCPPPVAGSVDPVREAERAVVEAAEAYCYGSSNYLRLLSATDALRAARKAKDGAS